MSRPPKCAGLVRLDLSDCSLACPMLAGQVSWHLRYGDAESARLMAAMVVESYLALTTIGTTEGAIAKLRELRRRVRPALDAGCEWEPSA